MDGGEEMKRADKIKLAKIKANACRDCGVKIDPLDYICDECYGKRL